MHDGVDVPALGEHVRHWRTEMPGLRGEPMLLVDVQMRFVMPGLMR
jgi:hypothetical protein